MGIDVLLSMNFNIDINEDRRLIVAKIYGIWKQETAEVYHDEYQNVARPLLGEKWAKLTNLTNWRSSYPEIIEVLGKHMHWCLENGAAYSTYVIDNPVTRNQLQKMISSGNAGTISKLFRTVQEADRFLREQGF